MAKLHYHGDFPNGWDGHVKLFPERLEQPLHWRKPRRIAVGLMGDLFHDSVPDEFIDKVFAVMALCARHTFQVLTKRPGRMLDYCKTLGRHHEVDRVSIAAKTINIDHGFYYLLGDTGFVIPNLWLGASVEDQKTADERIQMLLKTPSVVRFVSAEPLLGSIDLYRGGFSFLENLKSPSLTSYSKLDWVIAGGESGLGARPIHPEWVRSLRDQCVSAGVAFHFKQFGEWTTASNMRIDKMWPKTIWMNIDGRISDRGDVSGEGWECLVRAGKKAAGRMLDGREWLEFPK